MVPNRDNIDSSILNFSQPSACTFPASLPSVCPGASKS